MKYEGVDFNIKPDRFKTVTEFKERFKHLWPRDPNRIKKLEEVFKLIKLKK